MINGTGKQAIKNPAGPVTISFEGLQFSPAAAGRYAARTHPTPHSRVKGGKIDIPAPERSVAETER